MCGIVGFWDFKKRHGQTFLEKTVQKMADQIAHRGPDSFGLWVDERQGIALGHRRLSIVDLSPTGHQPMISRSERYIIIYNGEIYNAEEIRSKLIPLGYTFKGTSDTEVILEACDAWGVEKTASELIGMFAFSLWDQKERKLFIVRDRLGIKPLYWGFHNDVLFFGSQLKNFRPHPSFTPVLNQDAVASYLKFNYVPTPSCVFQDFYKLKPGHILSIDQNKNIVETQFWDLRQIILKGKSNLQKASPLEIQDQLETLMKDAVKRRMIADVPLGAFLSGGIDSSTVVALMQAQSSTPVKTFTIGFVEDQYNEAHYAKKVADHLKTEHYEHYLKAEEAFDIIPNLPEWFDEPFADSSQIPTYLVSKLARQHVTVSLSGDGGDELFAGYNRYKFANRMWGYLKYFPSPLKSALKKMIESLPPQRWNSLLPFLSPLLKIQNPGDKLHKLAKVLHFSDLQQLYENLISQWLPPANIFLQGQDRFIWPQQEKKLNDIENMQFMDMLTYLPDDILAKVDRASMAVSLEARVPLLDHRLVEFIWSIPDHLKIHNGQTKWILRQILNKYVPSHLFERPKVGFGIPLGEWLQGPLKNWASELLTPEKLQINGFNANPILEQWNNHQKGYQNWQYSLWTVLMFQSWMQAWNKKN
jgi:asparagine synthase (glutamine-hydrolysing)